MARADELRLVARVARLYFMEEMKQAEIAARLHISQAGISRLLRRARDEGIVRITVEPPRGTFPELEERLCTRYGLSEVIIADCDEDRDEHILARIGEAAGHYVETTLHDGEVIGISSWSESLLRTVDNIHPMKRVAAKAVVQILGGMGDPSVQAHANNLTGRLARLTHATPVLLATQGVAGSSAARDALLHDRYVQAALARFSEVTMALVGIGALEPSKLLRDSGNVFTGSELQELDGLGAVGDICLHFFDEHGAAVESPFDARVIGITLAELRRVPRVVAVAGGQRKRRALRAALRGGLVDVLITDSFTGHALAEDGSGSEAMQGKGTRHVA
jgi:DNA-binding transcriptional regulator LsrR (DeoR family)